MEPEDDPTSRDTVEMVINSSFVTLSLIKATVAQQEPLLSKMEPNRLWQEMMKIFAYILVFMCLLRHLGMRFSSLMC